MKREDINSEQINKILEAIMPVLMQNGLKATTMDSLASSLQMSKRTLYEIFGSKEEMFREAFYFFHKKTSTKLKEIYQTASNVMEGLIKCCLYNRDLMQYLSAEFIRDMEHFASQGNLTPENHRRHHYQNFYDVLQLGVKEGYFRNDINLMVQCRMLSLQMEALKRFEELFPKDITILEVFDGIITGFLRAISSRKGLEELELYMPLLTNSSIKNESI